METSQTKQRKIIQRIELLGKQERYDELYMAKIELNKFQRERRKKINKKLKFI